eukprot:CAMPEP_0202897506 /NCGR_PEP_ID=MMETSP1392-20130828/6250_1 /ASSEMBLY_ACC=CAM_ASM_000868 /TAXON_ID=225041 /ORGANISM="Chlamydomonas chlamydogama, Strain SAG 11-48b" /LENGTH=77 /DNA_ID=CAMNT_0049583163 /DNA_START=138 /DNA_END=369 /DNA_ORIENTATION=+
MTQAPSPSIPKQTTVDTRAVQGDAKKLVHTAAHGSHHNAAACTWLQVANTLQVLTLASKGGAGPGFQEVVQVLASSH